VSEGTEALNDRLYKQLLGRAFVFYAFPYLLLLLFLLDIWLWGNQTEMFFWALFLLLELPCSVMGLRLLTRAEKQKQTSNVKREMAQAAGLILGVVGSLIGVGGLALLFLVTM
jgi:hypothetical protein